MGSYQQWPKQNKYGPIRNKLCSTVVDARFQSRGHSSTLRVSDKKKYHRNILILTTRYIPEQAKINLFSLNIA